ncbi:MAG: nucleotidyltransferase domain-containing protein [Nitrospirota bacterium]
MRQQIIDQLKLIEQTESVRILLAVESGSRGWGFTSKNSDWDVRFIYIRQPDWYLSIDDKSDVLEYPLADVLDFSGWDIKKALKLFRKSNPPLLEWLRSPIVYLEQFSTAQQIRELSTEYFNPKSCLYHYLHIAVGNYREYLKRDRVLVKKYFYVLRPILACQWIERNNTMPPMEFSQLLDTQVEDKSLKLAIEELVKRKMNGEELDSEPKINIINEFLEERISYFEDYTQKYPFRKTPNTTKLDQLFRNTLKEVWG